MKFYLCTFNLQLACTCDMPLPIRHLLSLKHYDGDIEELSLNFTMVNSEYGQSKVHHPLMYQLYAMNQQLS